eukprot:3688667-Alexandrium_andersonii.AAC.1
MHGPPAPAPPTRAPFCRQVPPIDVRLQVSYFLQSIGVMNVRARAVFFGTRCRGGKFTFARGSV